MTKYGIDPLRLLSLLLIIGPVLALLILGLVGLLQRQDALFWGMAMITSSGLGYGLQQLLIRRDRRLLAEAVTNPNPEWPLGADAAWQQIQVLAETCKPEDWPLETGDWILTLGQRATETVARCFHPKVEKPLLELTVPHTLLVIERASRDLRFDIMENIPFSNRLTIGDLFRMQRWKDKAERFFDIYRAGRMIINPVDGLLGEAWRHLRERSFIQARDELHRWFLRAYVRKVGYYAIDLYSGRLMLTDEKQPTQVAQTHTDAAVADENPLHILVLGRSNAGKSSLINALFNQLTTAVDVLPDNTRMLKPFVLSRDGIEHALIFDTPGCDSTYFDANQLLSAAQTADLVMWVSPSNRPDRQIERECLDLLRVEFSKQTCRRLPPLLVVASYIDLLRPANEWQPPYDLTRSENSKAANISAALQVIANDLAVPVERVIPVCLQENRVYNVDDTLWAAMLSVQSEAQRTRLLRCLGKNKKAENWQLLRLQMINAGRFLVRLPAKLPGYLTR